MRFLLTMNSSKITHTFSLAQRVLNLLLCGFFICAGINAHQTAEAQNFQLLKNIDDTPASIAQTFGGAVTSDGKIYFVGNDHTHGQELWVTDGTAFGTHLVIDLIGGPTSSNPTDLTAIGDSAYFVARGPSNEGNALYRAANGGISLVKSFSSDPNEGARRIVGISGIYLFTRANNGVNGEELWVTNTSTHVTTLLDINSGSSSSNPEGLGSTNSTFYLSAYRPDVGYELFKSTNGAAPTLVEDINISSAGASSHPHKVGMVGSTLYFSADDGVNGRELWRSSGTPATTSLVGNLNAGSNSSDPYLIGAINLKVIISAVRNITEGRELFVTDGISVPTLLKDINGAPNGSSNVYQGVPVSTTTGNRIFFNAFNPGTGNELYSTDGTTAGTKLVVDLVPGPVGSYPYAFYVVNDRLFSPALTPSHGYEPFITSADGNSFNVLQDLNPGGLHSNPIPLGILNSNIYFAALVNGSQMLLKSNLTSGTTTPIANLAEAGQDGDSFATPIASLGGKICYSAQHQYYTKVFGCINGVNGAQEILRTNFHFNEISTPTFLGGGVGIFGGYDTFAATGSELWRSDGTAAGTFMIKDINPGIGDAYPHKFVEAGGQLFFIGNDSNTNAELWRTDGSAAGTIKLTDLAGVDGGLAYTNTIAAIGNRVVFDASSVVQNGENEPWTSDGTVGGTGLLLNINPSGPSRPEGFVSFNGKLYFTADDGSAHGRELWSTSGFPGSTALVKDLRAGSDDGIPSGYSFMLPFKGHLYFTGYAQIGPQLKTALYRTDGTSAGTGIFLDPAFVGGQFYTTSGLATNQFMFMVATDESHGSELWRTDGTQSGTVLVKDITPGGIGSQIFNLKEFDGQVYFSVASPTDQQYVYQVWRTDGTEVGTVPVTNYPVSPQGAYGAFILPQVGNLMLLGANVPGVGVEPLYAEDQCPDHDGLLIAGVCGCGVPVIDSNGNGIADCQGGSELKPILNGVFEKVTAMKALPKEPTKAQKKKFTKNKKALNTAIAILMAFGSGSFVNSVQVSSTGINVTTEINGIANSGKLLPKKKGKAFTKAKKALLSKITSLKAALVN
jgi:ELWxxDGT repeat protein